MLWEDHSEEKKLWDGVKTKVFSSDLGPTSLALAAIALILEPFNLGHFATNAVTTITQQTGYNVCFSSRQFLKNKI